MKVEKIETESTDNTVQNNKAIEGTHPDVLTLTIVDGTTLSNGSISNNSRVLCCVRNDKVNRTHPNVVSVPTQRMPASLAHAIIYKGKRRGVFAETSLLSSKPVLSSRVSGHDPLIFAVESLLSRKLGVADALEADVIKFEAVVAGVHNGTANYENLSTSENLRMINVKLVITEGIEHFPNNTTSYDIINWIKVENFLRMWDDGKDVSLAGIGFEKALGICVDGLCILSTYDILSDATKT